jgi:hypothetical protein
LIIQNLFPLLSELSKKEHPFDKKGIFLELSLFLKKLLNLPEIKKIKKGSLPVL